MSRLSLIMCSNDLRSCGFYVGWLIRVMFTLYCLTALATCADTKTISNVAYVHTYKNSDSGVVSETPRRSYRVSRTHARFPRNKRFQKFFPPKTHRKPNTHDQGKIRLPGLSGFVAFMTKRHVRCSLMGERFVSGDCTL